MFGFSFGSNKSKTTSDSTGTKTESGTQTGTSTTNATNTTNTNSSTQNNSLSQGESATSTSGTSKTAGTQATTANQVSSLFDTSVLGKASTAISNLLDLNGDGDSTGAKGMAINLGAFDPEQYVAQGLRAAQAGQATSLDEIFGGIKDMIGGKNNSMTQLLEQRAQTNSDASLAGTQATLTNQAYSTAQGNVAAASAVNNQQGDFLTNLLTAIKGGQTTTSGTTGTTTNESTDTSQNSDTQTAEQQQSTSDTQSQSVSSLIQILQQLMQTNDTTNTTESTKGTSSGTSVGATGSLK